MNEDGKMKDTAYGDIWNMRWCSKRQQYGGVVVLRRGLIKKIVLPSTNS